MSEVKMRISECQNLKDIYAFFRQDEKDVVQSLQEEGMLLPLRRCPKKTSRTAQILDRNTDFKGHYAAYCKKCKKFSSLCKDTFFEGTHQSFEDIFVALWTWICHVSQHDAASLTGISRNALNQDIASWKILNTPHRTLGGEGVVVQIDESVITKRKCNRGKGVRKSIPEKWVLGLYDTDKKTGVVLYVVKRDRATLAPLIRQYCKEGSILWTDGWAAYKGLDKFGFKHHVVNHSKEFKSADGSFSNWVEGYWSTLKQYCRHTNVLKSKLLAEHIDEFAMYHQYYCGSLPYRFRCAIDHIKERYPVV
ncbi:putative transposase-like protein [Frankliniella fusca]|uniref:Transposase-like protein n=1 Tax=Frankliniella fusca TaxID=407009 RepID=A0AAE1GUW2_9NEOP|nr:putative transposase-like protein [Frankliniella fusca]